MKNKFSTWIKTLQDEICTAIEETEIKQKFKEDIWQREGGGSGITRVLKEGDVIEKGGVNTSSVYGKLNDELKRQLKIEGDNFFACGISLVIHPRNPQVPTTHANYRFFEVYDAQGKSITNWFGGVADLTPYILDHNDARHFHLVHKASCDKFNLAYYPQFKKECDNYFKIVHRNNERRGVGGIFYDYQKPDEIRSEDDLFNFAQSNGRAFIDAYIPIINKNKNLPFTEQQKNWQLVRRSRYVEFNLIYDRGTIFGLKSNGRTESILMSLPLWVKFDYDYKILPNSEEDKLQQVLLNPREWV